MARGGFRPGAGRPKTASSGSSKNEDGFPSDIVRAAEKSEMSPLDYMLNVMRNDQADQARRDRMAIAAAPFVHARADVATDGKKAQRQANAEQAASSGKFAASPAPRVSH